MRAIANWIFLIAMSFWLGPILFFSFVLTPTLKANVAPDQFYQTINVLFPTYFGLGLVAGVLALLVAVVRTLRTDRPKRLLKWVNVLIIVMLILNVIGSYVLIPEMQSLEQETEQFIQYYNFAQGINLLNLMFGILVLLLISVDMRILPGKLSRGGYSIHF